MGVKMIYSGKKALLLDEGREAIKSQDWDKVLDIASYDAEVGSTILSLFEEKIPLEKKCKIALYHYSNQGDFYPIIRKYIKKARIIRPENWREKLPSSVRDLDTFTIYRGGGDDIMKVHNALSWTLSQEVAEWFMKRHDLSNPKPQQLYKGTITANKVIAYIGGRDEFEIVQYRSVKNIVEIIPCGLSAEFDLWRHQDNPFSVDPDREKKSIAYFDTWYFSRQSD